MEYTVRPAKCMIGAVRPPADKSVAHRAAIFASIADGVSRIDNYPRGADTMSTVACMQNLGVNIHWDGDALIVEGRGPHGLRAPDGPLDCGNSGTTMRLLAGLLAGQNFTTVLTGDDSLQRRPMERIAEPLRLMGVEVRLEDGRAPITIKGNPSLRGIEYVLPVSSAQVKSAVLLAGLYARDGATVVEPIPTRDHTERMLGLSIEKSDGGTKIRSNPGVIPAVVDMDLPGDISSAAFFMAAGLILDGSLIRLQGVGINPSRTGIIDALEAAGGVIEAINHRMVGREPVCDLAVSSTALRALQVTPDIVPRLIDEIPILAVAATQASGVSTFEGVAELRAKESDRIASVSSSLTELGAVVTTSASAFEVAGPVELQGGVIDSRSDHRIAMAMAVAGLLGVRDTKILGAEAANVSYPGFWEDLERLAVR